MLKIEQYQKLKRGDQIRFSKEVYTVRGHQDFGTYVECTLVSDEGVKLYNGIYITHLMAFNGSVELIEPGDSEASVRLVTVETKSAEKQFALEPKIPTMTEVDALVLDLYLRAERI